MTRLQTLIIEKQETVKNNIRTINNFPNIRTPDELHYDKERIN